MWGSSVDALRLNILFKSNNVHIELNSFLVILLYYTALNIPLSFLSLFQMQVPQGNQQYGGSYGSQRGHGPMGPMNGMGPMSSMGNMGMMGQGSGPMHGNMMSSGMSPGMGKMAMQVNSDVRLYYNVGFLHQPKASTDYLETWIHVQFVKGIHFFWIREWSIQLVKKN